MRTSDRGVPVRDEEQVTIRGTRYILEGTAAELLNTCLDLIHRGIQIENLELKASLQPVGEEGNFHVVSCKEVLTALSEERARRP